MGQTLYFLDTNDNVSLCDSSPFAYDLQTSVGDSGVADITLNSSTFVEAGYWDFEPISPVVITGTHAVSVSVSSITSSAEYRFRVQQIDGGSCSVVNNSSYSATYSTSGIKTENLALTWTGTTGILRISFELRKTAGTFKTLSVNANSDSYIRYPSAITETASGGVVAGGVGVVQLLSTKLTSGGSVAGGTVTPNTRLFPSPTGGAVGSGTALISNVMVNFLATGGAVVAGDAIEILNDNDIHYEVGDGGAVVAGDAPNTAQFNLTTTGGVIAGGSGIDTSIVFDEPSGGVVIAGNVETSVNDIDIFDEIAVGGVVVGGEALDEEDNAFWETGSGGLVAGGEATLNQSFAPVLEGGLVAGGDALALGATIINGSGGVVAGGQALKESPVYHFRPTGTFVIATGRASYRTSYRYTASGGVEVEGSSSDKTAYRYTSSGMSSDAPPNFSGITIGYQNHLNPTTVKITYNIDIGSTWNRNAFIERDLSFTWNTGRIRQYWYRVVGNTRQTKCDPIYDCCQKVIVNVHARSIDDLCQKLRDRRWHWPIEIVQKFSRPAETADIAEDEANGIDHTCNTVEEIEVCGHLLCAEFCIDYDLIDHWGITTTSQLNAFREYEADGSIVLGGSADARYFRVGYDQIVEGSGELTIGGAADYISSGYTFTGSGGLELNGNPDIVASTWSFEGGQWPLGSLFDFGTEVDQFNLEISDQEWSLPERALAADDLFTSVDLSWGKKSEYLVVKGFPLNIPAGANVLGIRVDIERKATSQVRDSEIYLVVGDEIVSDNLAKNTIWPIGVDVTSVYGGIFNTWRDSTNPDYLGNWDLEDINNSDFGVAIRVEPVTIGTGVVAQIDFVKLVVVYETSTETDLIRVGGEAAVRSSNYRYTASGAVLIGQNANIGLKVSRRVAPNSLGRGAIGPEFAALRMGGNYEQNFKSEVGGEVFVGGEADCFASNYRYEATGGVTVDGSVTIRSSCYHMLAEGGVTLEGPARLRVRYKYLPSTGSLSVGGESEYYKNFAVQPDGGLTLGGTADVKSSAQQWTSEGSLQIGGSAEYQFSNYGTQYEQFGLFAQVLNLSVIFAETEAEEIEAPDDTINACGCNDLPLAMQFAHNMFRDNQLSQFLDRNNLVVPRINNLHYNRINNAWQSNFRWKGYSSTSGQQEVWTVVFELTCTNFIGGELIGQNIWKLGVNFIRKNISTGEDFDSKIVIGFFPDKVCSGSDFSFKAFMDTAAGFTTISPTSSVYQSLLYDNIGLFKTAYWQENPTVEIMISQVGISEPVPRYKLNIG